MKLNKVLVGFLIVVATVIVGAMLHVLNVIGASNQELSNSLYNGREISDDIVIIGIDERSLVDPDDGGLGSIAGWPYSYYSDVIKDAVQADASAVMVDILFSSESQGISEPEMVDIVSDTTDLSLVALNVLTYLSTPHPQDASFAESLSGYDNVYFIKNVTGEGELIDNIFYHNGATIEPIDVLNEIVLTGFTNLVSSEESDNSSTIYGIPAVQNVNGNLEEHIDLKLIREHLGVTEAGEFSPKNEKYYFGDKAIPIENGQMFVNFAKESYEWEMVSFVDVYRGDVSSSTFEDKIVLIGATTPLLQDVYFTPIDQNDPMPGIEIHANAIQTILDGEFLHYQGLFGFLAVLGLMAAGVVFATLYAPVWAGAGVLLFELISFPFYAKASFGAGIIPDLIWPVFAAVAAYLAALAYLNFTEFREKRKLKNAFGHYVSADLVEQIAANPDALKLGGERRNITVLFLDIENFTSLAESLEPAAVVQIINSYFDAFAKVIMENGGTVDKFEGDAIMAMFGAPLPSQDHGLAACKCAIALRARVQELNKQTGQALNIRVGVANGDAIVGNMGSVDRFDYTAMGDTVNTASRLESGNKFYGTRILVNSGVVDASQQQIIFRRIDRVRFKGKGEAIDIFEVMGLAGGASEKGKAIIEEWHQALEYYRNQNWAEAEMRIQKVLAAMPEDGPAKTYLTRIKTLKEKPMLGWDGTWGFSEK